MNANKETMEVLTDPSLMKAIAQGEKEIADGNVPHLEDL